MRTGIGGHGSFGHKLHVMPGLMRRKLMVRCVVEPFVQVQPADVQARVVEDRKLLVMRRRVKRRHREQPGARQFILCDKHRLDPGHLAQGTQPSRSDLPAQPPCHPRQPDCTRGQNTRRGQMPATAECMEGTTASFAPGPAISAAAQNMRTVRQVARCRRGRATGSKSEITIRIATPRFSVWMIRSNQVVPTACPSATAAASSGRRPGSRP
jgi:hypothetical protein